MYGEVLLSPFVTINDTKHEITLHLIYRDQDKKIINKPAGELVMEVFYT